MSTMDVAFDLPQAGTLPAHAPVRDVRSELRPWGFWGSLGWGLCAAAMGIVAVFICTIIWMLTHQLRLASPQDVPFSTAVGIAALTAPMVMLAIAVKVRQFPCAIISRSTGSRAAILFSELPASRH